MHSWFSSKRFRASPPAKRITDEINDRQAKVDGFSHAAHQQTSYSFVGCGGVNLPIILGAVLKGAGFIELLDHDIIDLSNLSRQYPFTIADVGKYKAFVAGKHFAKMAFAPLRITARRLRFQERYTLDNKPKKLPDIIVTGVDNNPTRRAVAAYAHAHQIPAIFPAVGRDANACYVYVQQPGHACWGCAFPEFLNDQTYPCNLPGSFDILSLAAGYALHAIDSLVSNRPREWNLRKVYLDGGLPDQTRLIEPRPNCPVCAVNHQGHPNPKTNSKGKISEKS